MEWSGVVLTRNQIWDEQFVAKYDVAPGDGVAGSWLGCGCWLRCGWWLRCGLHSML